MLLPEPRATGRPAEFRTVTVQAAAEESLAVNCTGPPRPPRTVGAYSFGNPIAATSCAMSGSLPYRAVPGQLVKPVSRWPEIARSGTRAPRGNFALPPETQLTSPSGSTC